jgi:23S rRNA (cytosine1962-C5)-methyltransferase
VQSVSGDPAIGEVINVTDDSGKNIAKAAYSPNSQIRARVWTFNPEEPVNDEFLYGRILAAKERRLRLPFYKNATALRLLYGEADGLPGLIVDKYNDTLVMQILSAGAEFFKDQIIETLKTIYQPDCIFERSDVEVRALEGLQEHKELVYGSQPKEGMRIEENGINYKVDIVEGQKTGFYLDQRENRQKVNELATGLDVLNCFCYTGGFTLNALAGGAKSVVSVDSSESACVF